MVKISKLSPAFIAAILFASTEKMHAQTKTSQPIKTTSGLEYIIHNHKAGENPKQGDFAKFQLTYTIGAKDSVLHSSFNGIPDYVPVDTGIQARYSFMEVIPKMSAGDSATFTVSVDTLVNKKMIPAYNDVFQQGSNIKCQVKLLEILPTDSAVKADYAKETELEKDREIKTIENYMAKAGMKGKKTASGAYVILETPGDTSLMADAGTTASIKYKGYLFNGNVFDTNLDSSKGHTDPISVTVGEGQVIKGWDEGLPYFGKGAKGKILIPAMLAYGPRAMGADIPAFSNLIFDIEIVDVKEQP